jgi:hypothetical protein
MERGPHGKSDLGRRELYTKPRQRLNKWILLIHADTSPSRNRIPINLKYLNRLSDLLFLLACLEEKEEKERRKSSRAFAFQALTRPGLREWAVVMAAIELILVTVVVSLLLYHGKDNGSAPDGMMEHMERMHQMQQH